jgi:PEP-CTERM motif
MEAKTTSSVLFAIAIGCAALPAAASTAQASLTNLSFTLVDLDTHDGIAPSFEILSGKGGGRATYMWTNDRWSRVNPLVRSAMPFASLSYGNPNSGNYRATGSTFATAHADGDGDVFLHGSEAPTAFACNDCRLLLSANTRLVVSGDYDLSAQDLGNPRHNPRHADGASTAEVHVLVTGGHMVFGDIDQSLSTIRDAHADSFSRSGAFTFNVDNELDRTRGNIFMSMSAESAAFGAAVPEPSTYAMMLAGLAMVGFVVRRRRSAVALRGAM